MYFKTIRLHIDNFGTKFQPLCKYLLFFRLRVQVKTTNFVPILKRRTGVSQLKGFKTCQSTPGSAGRQDSSREKIVSKSPKLVKVTSRFRLHTLPGQQNNQSSIKSVQSQIRIARQKKPKHQRNLPSFQVQLASSSTLLVQFISSDRFERKILF